jgi:hypothetical protein
MLRLAGVILFSADLRSFVVVVVGQDRRETMYDDFAVPLGDAREQTEQRAQQRPMRRRQRRQQRLHLKRLTQSRCDLRDSETTIANSQQQSYFR